MFKSTLSIIQSIMNIYRFAHSRRHLLIIFSLDLLIIFVLMIIHKTTPLDENISGFTLLAVILMAIITVFTFGTITNKIILSPAGFEYVSFGISLLMSWDTVEKVILDDFGIVNIIFRDRIFQNRWTNRILIPLASGHAIQLSSFIDDLSSSNLIRDIKHFAPHCDTSAFEEVK